MRRSMDRMMENFFGEGEDWPETITWGVALDVKENENEFVVEASLPGVKPEDVDVTFSNNTLTIKGEVRSEEEKEEAPKKRKHMRNKRLGVRCNHSSAQNCANLTFILNFCIKECRDTATPRRKQRLDKRCEKSKPIKAGQAFHLWGGSCV